MIPLYDDHVHHCYVGAGAPARPARHKERTWATFMMLLATAIRDDLRRQRDSFDRLATLAPGLTPLRALDILGWSLGGSTSEDENG